MTAKTKTPINPHDFFTAERVRAWASVLCVAELLFLIVAILAAHGVLWPHTYKPSQTDFASFYSAGTLANIGHANLAYDQNHLFQTEQSITHAHTPQIWFFYPPVYLMLCRVFAIPGYLLSYYLCTVIGLGLYFWTIARLWPEQRRTAITVAACLPPTFLCIGIGQNAFLSAAIFGTGLTLLRQRPILAGVVLSLLCYKPHFGLLLPIALICMRQWRAFGGAVFGVCACVLASIAMFGPGIWLDYIHATTIATKTFRDNVVPAYNLVNLYATCLSIGMNDRISHLVQGLAFLVAAAAVIRAWRFPCPQDLRNATLVAGALVAMPIVLYYDFVTLSLAGFWLARDINVRGARLAEYVVLVLIPPLYLLLYALCIRSSLSLGAIVPLAVLGLALWRLPNHRQAMILSVADPLT